MAAAFQRAGRGRLRQRQPVGRARHMGLVEQGVEDDEQIEVE